VCSRRNERRASEEQEGVGCCQIFFCVRIDTSIEDEEGGGSRYERGRDARPMLMTHVGQLKQQLGLVI
jgi:hypothetical protein